jgi:hypothetical protein
VHYKTPIAMAEKKDIQELIESGIKAPSGHNTQPWLFKTTENRVEIHPDFDRALPVVDTDNHALYISLGCAAENIVIAATQKGLQANAQLASDTETGAYIQIDFEEAPNLQADGLLEYIGQRQSTRNDYTQKPVPPEDLQQLANAFDFPEIRLMLFTAKEEIQDLEPFIIEGSDRQFANKAFVDELASWVRFSKNEAKETGDGIWVSSMGIPNMGKWIGKFMMKNLVTAKSEAKRWSKLIDASAGLALFVARDNNVHNWVTLGRAFQRFGLTATKLGIHHAHMNMPCEEVEVRSKLAGHLKIKDQHPLLLLRFGYSKKMPYSFRRDVEAVIME